MAGFKDFILRGNVVDLAVGVMIGAAFGIGFVLGPVIGGLTSGTRLGPSLPFYIAAPLSTFDPKITDGSAIVIEERPAQEVTGYRGVRWAPEGVAVRNPAFDVTPAELITGIICEKGVILKPDRERIAAFLR